MCPTSSTRPRKSSHSCAARQSSRGSAARFSSKSTPTARSRSPCIPGRRFPRSEPRFAKIGTNAWALFGQATYAMSSRVSLTGGAPIHGRAKRLSTVPEGRTGIGTDILARPRRFVLSVRRHASSFDAWTPKVSLQAQASHGHASSTFPLREASRAADSIRRHHPPGLAFNPEFAWSYEGGLKRSMAGGRVRANTRCSTPTIAICRCSHSSVPGVPDIRNAASASINGVEVEVAATALPGLRLSGPLLVAGRHL